jgi:hypothetical protein
VVRRSEGILLSLCTGRSGGSWSWPCSVAGQSGRRRSRSSCCGISCGCWNVRWIVRNSSGLTGRCWRRSAACCRERRGSDRCSWRPRPFCGGIGSWLRVAGPIRIGVRAGRRHRRRFVSSSCGSRARTRQGIPADPRRAGRARCQAGSEHGLDDAQGRRDRASTETARPELGEFLRPQAPSILECDFLTADTLFGKRFYVLFFIEFATRRVHIAGITTNPDGRWVTSRHATC